ncbi:MAG: hypothetical protein JO302_07045 [Candidatus Eremiobacteraeota bacterium]|nr:hypothetical protein [Candidatus Eremiobacteraeota bacterium]
MRRLSATSGYVFFALGIFTLVTTIVAVWRNYSPVPFQDQWNGTLEFYIRALHDPWHAFFEQHNEHRLVISRLVFFADVRYFGGRNVLSLTANFVFAGLLALTFFCIAERYRVPLRWTTFGLAGLVLIFTFSWIQSENFSWGFQNEWFAVYLFALLAFHSVELSAEANFQRDDVKSLGWMIAALVSATAAAYSLASGLLVFPLIIIQAAYLRIRFRELLVAAAAAASVWWLYLTGWRVPINGHSGDVSAAFLRHPLEAVSYALLYLGAPAAYALGGSNAILGETRLVAALVCGIIAVAVLAKAAFVAWQRGPRMVRATSLLALATFAAGNALLAASGRLWHGILAALAQRYTTASLAAWLALILFATLNAGSATTRRLALVAGLLATILVVYAQRFAFEDDSTIKYGRLVAGLALRAHVYDPRFIGALYPEFPTLVRIAKEADAAKISIFSIHQGDYPVPPKRVDSTLVCDGQIDEIRPTATAGIDSATGWIYDASSNRVPRDVIVTDTQGTTLGNGVTGGATSNGLRTYGKRAQYGGWTAFFKPPKRGAIRVVAEATGGRYCRLR